MSENNHPLSTCPNCDTDEPWWRFKATVTGTTSITTLECNECGKDITEVDGPDNEYAIYSSALDKEDREALRERYRTLWSKSEVDSSGLGWRWDDTNNSRDYNFSGMADIKSFPVALDEDLVRRMYQDELTAGEANVLQHYRNQVVSDD